MSIPLSAIPSGLDDAVSDDDVSDDELTSEFVWRAQMDATTAAEADPEPLIQPHAEPATPAGDLPARIGQPGDASYVVIDPVTKKALGQPGEHFKKMENYVTYYHYPEALLDLSVGDQGPLSAMDAENASCKTPGCTGCGIFHSSGQSLDPLLHDHRPTSFEELAERWDLPLVLFSQIFNERIYKTIAEHSNRYAQKHEIPIKPITAGHIQIWLGLVLYMGTFKIASRKDLWSRRGQQPIHCISRFMSFQRWKQIKRIIHLSNPDTEPPQHSVFDKVQPIASILNARFSRVYLPSNYVSIDEIMVKFTGRSKEIVSIKGKPIPVGYKILALADRGYVYSFLFTSGGSFDAAGKKDTSSIHGVNYQPLPGYENLDLTATSKAVVTLAASLPADLRRFVIFIDNFFTNVRLLSVLRGMGIGACGTTRASYKEYPLEHFKEDKSNCRWPLHKQDFLCVRDVGSLLWKDRVLVRFLHTIFDPDENDWVPRKRPATGTAAFQRELDQIYPPGVYEAPVLQPKAAILYNNFMGGVDIADQRRAYFTSHLIGHKTWHPILFWMLDTAASNAHILGTCQFRKKNVKYLQSLKDFRMQLAWNLVIKGISSGHGSRAVQAFDEQKGPQIRGNRGFRRAGNSYISLNTDFPYHTTLRDGVHRLARISGSMRRWCWFCRWRKLRDNQIKDRRTTFCCELCGEGFPLCTSCMGPFHSQRPS